MSTLKAVPEADHRQEPRVTAEIKAVVQVRESKTDVWKEVTTVSTLSRNGAGFSLGQPVSVGRLLTIVLPMPAELRAYDEGKDMYPVMGIVQYCNEGMIGTNKVHHVGVGFIGKQIPESFKSDPTQNYRITGMSKDGLWQITESGSKFQNRKQPRYWISLGVTLTLIQKEDKSITREETFTKNVGAGGVSVASSLNAAVGDTVKFGCKALNFYAIAVVRNRHTVTGETPTLHLEFKEDVLPVEKVIQMQAA